MKSGNLNFLEPSGPLQARNGTALPLFKGLRFIKLEMLWGGRGEWGVNRDSWDVCIAVCSVDVGGDKRTHSSGWSKFRTTRGDCFQPAATSSDFIGLCSDHDRN